MAETFLTERQIEILRLRRMGLTQAEIAKKLKTTRENINILEKRAYRNIRKAVATLETLSRLELAVSARFPAGTPILNIPKVILERADEAKIKVKMNCVEILEKVKFKVGANVKNKRLTKPIVVTILPDGSLSVE